MKSVSIFCPAKVNLFLAVTGVRQDGFHDLLSLVAPVSFGDILYVDVCKDVADLSLGCNDLDVPLGEENLILKAARLFVDELNLGHGFRFYLDKRIPMGAGLGGGSSDAMAALRAVNQLMGNALDDEKLIKLASQLGSDCPLFIDNDPKLIRGRGEIIERLSAEVLQRLKGQRLLIILPPFEISTPWAYEKMRQKGDQYYSSESAERNLFNWLNMDLPITDLLFNNMQNVAFEKFASLPVLSKAFEELLGEKVLMSGSGSACFLMIKDDSTLEGARKLGVDMCGTAFRMFECSILGENNSSV